MIFANKEIDFKAPYPRIPIYEAIKKYTNFDISSMDVIELRKTAKNLDVEIDNSMGKGKIIDAILVKNVRNISHNLPLLIIQKK